MSQKHRPAAGAVPLYRIDEKNSAVTIELSEVGDQGEGLLEAFAECQGGSCSCPTDEYQKVASIDVEHTDDTIRIRLGSKPGATIDVSNVAACLDHAIAATATPRARSDGPGL